MASLSLIALQVVLEADLVNDEAGTPALDETSDPPQVKHVSALSMVRVKLECEGIVAVRPWYKQDGKWYPLHADGAAGVGPEPVTSDDSIRLGRSVGYFAALGLSHPVAMVAEDGDPSDVHECTIESADSNIG